MNFARCYDDYAENWLMVVYPQMHTCPLGSFILRSSPFQKVGSRGLKKSKPPQEGGKKSTIECGIE